MTVRAILFDVGDTLVRLGPMERDLAPDLASVLTSAGIECSGRSVEEQSRRAIQGMLRDYFAGFEEGRLEEDDIAAMLAAHFAADGVDVPPAVAEDLATVLGRADVTRLQPWPGVIEHLHALRDDGYRLAAVSNTTTRSALLHAFFEEHGLSPCFDRWVFSIDRGVRKPHPAIYQCALEGIGVAGHEAVFVGDRVREDVLGPRRAGIAHAVLTHEHRQEDPGDSNPCAVIGRLEELQAILPRLR
ncbi:MAG TPA: HAD family hydrolase [Tepidiformaceae bacterium]|nr:HAD family hydrolase [Tepidiformaceae bacterium]